MSPWLGSLGHATHSFPRVSGDEPRVWGRVRAPGWFSPRERG